MRWCQQHWDGLRAEVKRQGLDALVPDSGEKAAQILTRQIDGETSVDAFDPLMGAMWAINSFIGAQMGEGGFLAVLTYDGCPICKADEVHQAHCAVNGPGCTDSYARFFPNAVEDQRKAWESLSSGGEQ